MNPNELTLDSPVAAYVEALPDALPILEAMRIDYCCGARKPLRDACGARGLDPAAVRAALLAVVPRADVAATEPDWRQAPVADLLANLVDSHHAYLRAELDRLLPLADKVARVHGDHHPELVDLDREVHAFAGMMATHLEEEEQRIFPAIARLAGVQPGSRGGPELSGLTGMESDHEAAGASLARMRDLTAGFTPPEDACRSYRGLLHGLAALEADTHRHIHKENNILIPRAVALAGAA